MNQAKNKTSRPRPYWHVDLKWLTGIVALVSVAALLLTIGLYRLTARERAIEMATTAVASAFSPDGLDDASALGEFSQDLAASPTGELRPFPGLNVVVRESEIKGLSARQIRFYIFRQITEPLYDRGPDAVDQLVSDPEARSMFESQLGASAWLTASAHATIGFVLIGLSLGSAIFLGLAVLFSKRFGRLVTPALIVLLAGFGPWLFLTVVASAQKNAPTASAASLSGVLAREIVPFVVLAFSPTYLWATLLSLALLLAALVGFIIQKKRHASRAAR